MTAPAIEHDRTLIDWLTITHDDRAHLAQFLRGPRELRRSGIITYRTSYEDGHGAILGINGPEPRPFLLQMSGKPLASWRDENTQHELVSLLTEEEVRCTRLDLARDTTGPMTPYLLQEFIESDRTISKAEKPTYHHGKGNSGLTVYLGSPKSAFRLRCYDKKAEMASRDEECPFDRLSRWEIQLRGDLASSALFQLARVPLELDEETGVEEWAVRPLHAAWLGQRLRLTVDPVDREGKNHSRAETHPMWAEFLSGAADDILVGAIDERSIADQLVRLVEAFRRTASGNLALIHYLGGAEAVQSIIDEGRGRPSAKRDLIRSHADELRPILFASLLQG